MADGVNLNKEELMKFCKTNEYGCLEWQRYTNKHGYAHVYFNGKQWSVHRLSYLLNIGAIPKNKWVLHRCDNRKCINPDHLFLGNNKINTQDRVNKNRSARGEGNGSAKLTIEDVKKIKILFKEGRTGIEITKMFNVSQPTIYEIRRNAIWKHVTI